MVKTSDYLNLNKEIEFTSPLKMLVPAGESSGPNKPW